MSTKIILHRESKPWGDTRYSSDFGFNLDKCPFIGEWELTAGTPSAIQLATTNGWSLGPSRRLCIVRTLDEARGIIARLVDAAA